MRALLETCYKNITRKHPGKVLIGALLLGTVSLYIASGLVYDPRMDNLLPDDLPLVQEFNEVVDKTGGSGPLVVVLENAQPEQARVVIEGLTKQFHKIPGIMYVDSKLPMEFLKNRQLLLASKPDLLELEKELKIAVKKAEEQADDLFGDPYDFLSSKKLKSVVEDFHIFDEMSPYYQGSRQKNYYIFLQPKGTVTNTDFTAEFVESVKKGIASTSFEEQFPELKIKLSGSFMVRLEENNRIIQDLLKSAVLAAILTTSIILIYTRSLFSIPLVIFPLFLSITYTFALARMIIGHINIVSGFLIAILMGLGIDYGIHLYIRFKQELLKGKPIAASVELVVTQVGRSGVMAMFTTLSVFSLLIFSEFKGFSEFGKIASLGIVCSFLTYFFVFPAQVLYYDTLHWIRKPKPRLFRFKISRLYSNTPYFLTILFLLLMITSLFLVTRIEFEQDFKKLRGVSPAADYETQTTEDFGFAFSPTLILVDREEDLFPIHKTLETLRVRNGDKTTIGMVQSLNLFSQQEYNHKKEVIDRIRDLFEENSDTILFSIGMPKFLKLKAILNSGPFDESKFPDILKKKFNAKGSHIILLYSPADKNFFDARNLYQLKYEINELKKMLEDKKIDTSIMNENLLAATILDWVIKKGPIAMFMAMAMVMVILLIDLKSIKLALKMFLPLFTGLAMSGAIMGAFDVKLNFINIVMLPSIVGIMIDHCIYLGHHILDHSHRESVESIRETGSAVLLSSLTSLAGYASLNIADHGGVQSIAHVVEIGIITCTVCALFMLPALFELSNHKLAFIKSRDRLKLRSEKDDS